MRPRLPIICPAVNEEAALPLFFERTRAVMSAIADRYNASLLFINNGSTDGTLAFVRSAAERFPGVYFATLSKNVGYQRAVECGLRIAKGDLFIVIDADCEDPPEMIPEFLACHVVGLFRARLNFASPGVTAGRARIWRACVAGLKLVVVPQALSVSFQGRHGVVTLAALNGGLAPAPRDLAVRPPRRHGFGHSDFLVSPATPAGYVGPV